MGSLQYHESHINKSIERTEEQDFQVKEEHPIQNEKSLEQGARGCGRGSFRDCYAVEEENVLFMARSTTIDYKTGVQFVDNGCSHHMTGERKGFKDLDETKMRRIWLGESKEIQVEDEGTIAVQTSQDSDWAGNVNDKKSISGNLFTLGSAAITWSSKKQSTTSLSSSDAEYVAAASSTCQVLWLRKLLGDLHQEQKRETNFFCDNL
ncbi:hypothetical protein KY284_000846 [Solanum tuberosum]|nr:hypothetical protein KY284_000846 [Solanum tuberosum]